jgi:hypothetical protein
MSVNGEESIGVIESSEQTIIDQLVERLTQKYPAVPSEKVTDVVRTYYARFDGRPIWDYVPLFVERHARQQLNMLG